MSNDRRVRLVLVAGLHREPAERLATRLLRAAPRTAAVHYDLRRLGEGLVGRRTRRGGSDTTATLGLAHGCVSCTLREDLLPLLRSLVDGGGVDRVVLHLDPLMEPEPVCWALRHVEVGGVVITDLADVEAVVAVVDEHRWLDEATGDAPLVGCGLGATEEDERTLAQVAVGQVEFADAIVLAGGDTPRDAWGAARLAAVLDRLAPGSPRADLAEVDPVALLAAVAPHARRGAVADAHGPLLRGLPPLEPDSGVCLVVFRERRPFHPARLHDALDALLDGVVRARGRMWVAGRPDAALWLESAGGGLGVAHAGAWLAALPDADWDRVDPERRVKAALDWDPRFGDRVQELVVLAHRAAPEEITAALAGALLTDEELAEGEDAWARYPDPFDSWHADPCA